MAYQIYLTNGSLKTTVIDGTIDQTATDLTLLGKNSTGYGVFLNDNFINLLENFANSSQPNKPLTGQLWYDTGENRLKVYNGTVFAVTSGTIVANTVPSGITSGDLWIDSANGQLYFNDGTSTTLAGPIYSRDQGISGFNVETVIDVNGVSHTVLVLYVSATIVGIYSKTTFVPASTLPGFTSTATITAYQIANSLIVTGVTSGTLVVGQTLNGANVIANTVITNQTSGTIGGAGTYTVSTSNIIGSPVAPITIIATSDIIKIGFNTGSYPGILYSGLVSQAQSLLAANGSLKTAESFLTSSDNNTASGTLTIQNNTPLILGAASNMTMQINPNSNTFTINSNTLGQNFGINLKNSGGTLSNSLYINTNTQRMGIYTANPNAMLDVAGDTIIQGNLTVLGSTETISSTVVTIADKNIELAKVASPTDTTASGGGITVKGTTDKFLTWTASANTSSASTNTGYWNLSDYVNVSTAGADAGYYINGQQVVSATSLGNTISSAPGLTSVGTLTSLAVSNLTISGNTISYTTIQVSGNIVLQPKGTGHVSVSSARIKNLATPFDDTDAASKVYVDDAVAKASLGIGLETGSLSDVEIGIQLIQRIFPPGEHRPSTLCRVQCQPSGIIKLYSLQANVWTWQLDLI
jgi:hypothetical protein